MRYKTMSPKQRKAMLWWADPKTTSYNAIICDGLWQVAQPHWVKSFLPS